MGAPIDTDALLELMDINFGLLPWRRFLFSSQDWDYKRKKALQLALLRGLSQEFDLNIATWRDFGSRPIMDKSSVRSIVPHNPESAIKHETSGSSGIPFSFYRDTSLEAIDAAIFERAWSWVGRRDQLVLRLVSGSPKWRYFDFFRNIAPMNYRTVDDSYVKWVLENRPFLIHGVAGAIHDLAERIVSAGHAKVLKGIALYLMSEDTRSHRKALTPYFRGIYMGYGNAECRTVASECSKGSLHVNMETAIAESIHGELYVTNLHNKVTPFMRYATGDKGEVVQEMHCQCGIVSDVIVGVEGKVIDYYSKGLKKPTGWWLVSPISHEYGDLVSAWRLEVIPKKRLVRVFVVPKARSLKRLDKYLSWLESNTGFHAEIIKTSELPNWRRQLLRVVAT